MRRGLTGAHNNYTSTYKRVGSWKLPHDHFGTACVLEELLSLWNIARKLFDSLPSNNFITAFKNIKIATAVGPLMEHRLDVTMRPKAI